MAMRKESPEPAASGPEVDPAFERGLEGLDRSSGSAREDASSLADTDTPALEGTGGCSTSGHRWGPGTIRVVAAFAVVRLAPGR